MRTRSAAEETHLYAFFCHLSCCLESLVELGEQAAENRGLVSHSVLIGYLRVLLRGGVSQRGQRGEETERQRAYSQPHGLFL